jgi:hypothetical protein
MARTLLKSALDGGGRSASCTGRCTPRGKSPRYPLDSRLGSPQSRSGHQVKKHLLTSAGNRTPVVQAVAKRYRLSYPGSSTLYTYKDEYRLIM